MARRPITPAVWRLDVVRSRLSSACASAASACFTCASARRRARACDLHLVGPRAGRVQGRFRMRAAAARACTVRCSATATAVDADATSDCAASTAAWAASRGHDGRVVLLLRDLFLLDERLETLDVPVRLGRVGVAFPQPRFGGRHLRARRVDLSIGDGNAGLRLLDAPARVWTLARCRDLRDRHVDRGRQRVGLGVGEFGLARGPRRSGIRADRSRRGRSRPRRTGCR